MKSSSASIAGTLASWRDYYELCKPRVVLLMLLTSMIGMFMATPGMVPWQVLLFGNLGIALCAGSAAAVNHLVDRRIDLIMARTHDRPVAQGRVDTMHAILFALVLGVLGMAVLITQINQLTAWLTLASLLGYAVVYTLWLKRATPQNIVIGGLAGAAPPLLGWTAVTNSVDGHGLLLVLIIFAWTPPHFWALAVHRRDEYAKADIPMLPVTHGIALHQIAHPALHADFVCGDIAAVRHAYERPAVFARRRGARYRLFVLVGDDADRQAIRMRQCRHFVIRSFI